MDIFIWIFIIGALFTVGGWIIWMVFFVWLAKTAIRSAERDFIQNISQVEALLSQISQMDSSQFPSQQQNQIIQKLMQTQSQWKQLDDLSRQRYENRVGDLMGMASSAGIDWSPD